MLSCTLIHHSLTSPNLSRNLLRNTLPELTPLSPSAFPSISIHILKLILQPRLPKLRQKTKLRFRLIWRPARSIQIYHTLRTLLPDRPHSSSSLRRKRRVTLHNHVSPNLAEGRSKGAALLWISGSEKSGQVFAVRAKGHAVLVFVRLAGGGADGGGLVGAVEPITGTDEGRLGVDILFRW